VKLQKRSNHIAGRSATPKNGQDLRSLQNRKKPKGYAFHKHVFIMKKMIISFGIAVFIALAVFVNFNVSAQLDEPILDPGDGGVPGAIPCYPLVTFFSKATVNRCCVGGIGCEKLTDYTRACSNCNSYCAQIISSCNY